MRRIRRIRLLGLTVVLALGVAAAALAHDPPVGNGFFRSESGLLLLRTNRGLVSSADGGDSWQLLCNEALGINTSEVPGLLPVDQGSWLVGTSVGLHRLSADQCTLQGVPQLASVAVTTLTRDPVNPGRMFASTGQADRANGLYWSENAGESFVAYGEQRQNRIFERVFVSPANTNLLFASGLRLRDDGVGFEYFFAASLDMGLNFEELPFELESTDYGVSLLGVDPVVENRLYGVVHAKLSGDALDRFMVSTSGGDGWQQTLSAARLYAFAQDRDTRAVYVGGTTGLFRSNDLGTTFEQLDERAVHCLAHEGGRLWVCDVLDGEAGLSRSDDGGATLQRVMTFRDVTRPVACPVDSVIAATCAAPWADWQRELGPAGPDAGAGGDAGMPTAGSGGPSARPPTWSGGTPAPAASRDDSCACSTVGARTGFGLAGYALLLPWLGLVARVRRRRRLAATESMAERAHALTSATGERT